jgi:hypothetical protein
MRAWRRASQKSFDWKMLKADRISGGFVLERRPSRA